MRICARKASPLDEINRCLECGGPMVKVGSEYRCMSKVEPEELVATGFVPFRGPENKVTFDYTTKDQQLMQGSQASSGSVEIDDSYLQQLGLSLEKIREYQEKHRMLP